MVANERGLRAALLILTALGALGLAAELALASHWHGWFQRVPLALCALTAVSAALVVGRRPSPRRLLSARVGFVAVGVGCAVGIGKHLYANYGFAAEIRPTAELATLLAPTLQGASPTLAPGALGLLAAMGLLATWHGSALRRE